jgi:formate hydrogenlyase transcriptional activator
VLQDGEVQRLGATRSRKVDFRLVAATNQDLERAMAEGRFRRDLYYRLSVFPIRIPALRERREDIPLITWAFVERRQKDLGRRIEQIPQSVMDALVAYDWPGNVRELENVLERALILSPGKALRLDDPLRASGRAAAVEAGPPAAHSPVTESAPDRSFDGVAREHVRAVLERCAWRINGPGGAAAVLAVHPNTLRSRMRRLGLARPQASSIAR